MSEILKGIEGVNDVARKQSLTDWLQANLPAFFVGRILEVDADTADHWGRLIAQAERPLSAIDSLIAATAYRHGLTLITRNVKDFVDIPVDLFNSWDT